MVSGRLGRYMLAHRRQQNTQVVGRQRERPAVDLLAYHRQEGIPSPGNGTPMIIIAGLQTLTRIAAIRPMYRPARMSNSRHVGSPRTKRSYCDADGQPTVEISLARG
jgi:hypothetical protein